MLRLLQTARLGDEVPMLRPGWGRRSQTQGLHLGGRMMKGDPATSFNRLDSRAMCSSPLPPLIVARPSLPAKEEHTVGSSGSGKHSLSPSHRIVMVFLDFEIVMAFLVLEISVSLC
jgi:hypothetical protein